MLGAINTPRLPKPLQQYSPEISGCLPTIGRLSETAGLMPATWSTTAKSHFITALRSLTSFSLDFVVICGVLSA